MRREVAVAVVERDEHAGAAEADELGGAVAGRVGEVARKGVVARPAAGGRAAAEGGEIEIVRLKIVHDVDRHLDAGRVASAELKPIAEGPAKQIEIAVAIEVDEGWSGGTRIEVDAGDRIVRCLLRHELRRRRSAGIDEQMHEDARGRDNIKVAVAVEVAERRLRAEGAQIDTVERIVGAGLDVELRHGRGAVVAEEIDRAVALPDQGIEIAVPVEVPESGRRLRTDIDAVEGIGGASLLGERRNDADIGSQVVFEEAVVLSDDEVAVTVAVEIGECGRGIGLADGRERVGSALRGEGRRRRRTGVEEIAQRAAAFAENEIEVHIPVHVREGWRGFGADGEGVERVGRALRDAEIDCGPVLQEADRAVEVAGDEIHVAVLIDVTHGHGALGHAG